MDFLWSHKWTERYTGVSFIPHKTNAVYTAIHKVAMFKKQNEWASSLKRTIVNVKQANKIFQIDGSPTTFQNWLSLTPFGGKHVILGVEVAPKNVVRILFNEDDRYDVEHIIQNLFAMTVEKFGKDLAQEMLNESELQKIQANHKKEINHSQTLLQLSSNPQGGSESTQFLTATSRKTNFHYGSYLDVTKGEQTQPSEITSDNDLQTIDDLRAAIKEIKSKQDSFEANLSSTIDTAVESKIKPLQTEITTMKSSAETKMEEVLNTLNSIQSNQATAIAAAVTNAMTAFLKTPSSRAELLPGESQ